MQRHQACQYLDHGRGQSTGQREDWYAPRQYFGSGAGTVLFGVNHMALPWSSPCVTLLSFLFFFSFFFAPGPQPTLALLASSSHHCNRLPGTAWWSRSGTLFTNLPFVPPNLIAVSPQRVPHISRTLSHSLPSPPCVFLCARRVCIPTRRARTHIGIAHQSFCWGPSTTHARWTYGR